ncbi:MAG: ankyrin repeat domain-containing protein [Sulfuritalea sp.]|nr:ankyrin repeat domain-containing protein [Sulfuritalea sp.]
MDIVRQKQIREWALLGLVGMMALVANLPGELLASIGIETGLVMAVLGLMVVLALFLYVRFFFFLLYTLLAVGANLPEQWADSLHISQGPMLMALIAMVVLSLMNYGAKLMPSGLEHKKRKQNPEATQVLLNAIDRGNDSYVKTVLSMDFDLDTVDVSGMTPLMRAAQRGNFKVVQMLIKRGASPLIAGPTGKASDVALAHNFPSVSEYLRRVEEVQIAESAKHLDNPSPGESAIVA